MNYNKSMQKILFIDRDGTLILEPDNYQVDRFDKLIFYPEVIQYLSRIASELDYILVMVSNQDGLGTASFPEESFLPVQQFMIQTLRNEGIRFYHIHIDRSFAHERLSTRKPGIGMLRDYLDNQEYDIEQSFVIGDRITDVQLASNLGCKAIFINTDEHLGASEVNKNEISKDTISLKTQSWKAIYNFLKQQYRSCKHVRRTNETSIDIALNLDGSGIAAIQTGIAFFDHMLEQIAKHGQIDLSITVKGDLEVDEHHTIEDTAIALGEAIYNALGKKTGIERYGFSLPMDDCLAQASIDFGGRPYLQWEAIFQREYIGKMPTEMFIHFFRSFAEGAKANLNIKAEGANEHHKIEAIFKAFARAMKAAIKRDQDKMLLPSTKGML
jgi:imidazoleglycerol-phosphate dehydratase/histidinol-phosphatase